MLQRFSKTLYASISTAHKAYLETSVSIVVGVVKKRRSHQKHCGGMGLASYPGRVGGEKWPGIDCLRMRDHSQKTVGKINTYSSDIFPYHRKVQPFAG